MPLHRTRRISPRLQASFITVLVVALAVFTWITPPHALVLHNVLHHLNILPFMLAGLLFGWRGALKTLLFATVLLTPSIHRHWYREPLDAQDEIVELSTFGAAGLIAGVLADRERLQRRRVEETKQELEQLHTELQRNIDQMKKTERLTAAGELAASLAHEIRNPLASISGAAGILARRQAPEQSREECL
ncbi:MAG TPA: histidine kinase dimerization/phospho-acceptor domain-containing protein, partial [Granulicella sp.]